MQPSIKMTLPTDSDFSGRSFGEEEILLLREVIESGTLNCTKGTQVKLFENEFANRYDVPHCRAVSSGTAACHTAYAALDLEPGTEVITTPITDMGAIGPLLYQQLIPVFADVDPISLNMTPESIEAKISDRTGAIVVTHLFGNPCDMKGIMEVANRHRIPVIEDCAQAYLATIDGKLTGTFGVIGCFSMQQGKHITCGEGGMMITSDPALARRMVLFSDKAWGYGDPKPDHYFLAPNYRLTELQGAVARAQLRKLDSNVAKRLKAALWMNQKLANIPGITLPISREGDQHTYWRYPLIIDSDVIPGGSDAFGSALKERGVYCMPRYIQKPAFECQVLRDQNTFGTSHLPYSLPNNKPHYFSRSGYPGAYQGLSHVVVLPWNEKYEQEHLEFISSQIVEVVKCLQ